jgi:TolA-binding protein
VSLYAAIGDDLKTQIFPTQKPTTLNQWKRIVYHDEDPLKLYNTASSPVWYIDDKEKNCLFILGLCAFLNENYDKASKVWRDGCRLNTDTMQLAANNWPNMLMRLSDAAKFKTMTFPPQIKKLLKSEKERIKIQTAEFYYILERFEDMQKLFQNISVDSEMSDNAKALAYIGLGMSARMTEHAIKNAPRKKIAANYQQAMKLAKDTPIEEYALVHMAFYFQSGTTTYADGEELIKQYLKKYPQGKYVPKIKFREGLICLCNNDVSGAKRALSLLLREYPQSPYTKSLTDKVNDPEFLKFLNRNQKKQAK